MAGRNQIAYRRFANIRSGDDRTLSNRLHRDGPGFGISLFESCCTSGVYLSSLRREGADTPEAGMFGDMQSDLGRGEAALFDCG
jgi:hypothetical protein